MMYSSPAPNREFFKVGGTLPPDAPSYIERQADQELYERVLAGDFCYVLTPRQMGKSSLMARTAKRLQEQDVRTAIVDLTQIGTEKEKQSADQWYYGISRRIQRELGLNVNLSQWWNERQNLPALQRLTEFYRDLVLENIAERVVIFVDEIDTTIALPFADDFFAAIRACYNARATEPAYQRLSLVLLGVASPSDLMKDPQRTPFNIGRRIDLTDFIFAEAKPLAQGLGRDETRCEQALRRILYWTNGHPYLTQKLCVAVLEEKPDDCSDDELDRLVDRRLLSAQAHRDDSNLNFVRDRLLEDKARRRPMLKLYHRIRSGKQVPDDPRSPVHATLKLSGLVAPTVNRLLMVRNRIYERVFTPQWAKATMPVNWERRIAIVAFVTLFVTLLGISAWLQVLFYIRAIEIASKDVPNEQYQKLRRFPVDMSFFKGKANESMAQYWERRALLAETLEDRDQALLYRLVADTLKTTKIRQQEIGRLVGVDSSRLLATYRHSGGITAVAFSPDGKTVLTGSWDKTARLWRAESGQPIGPPMEHQSGVTAVAFSPDGKTGLIGSSDGTVRLWRTESGQPIGLPMKHQSGVTAVVFSPDGKTVLTGSSDRAARLWRAESGQPIGLPMQHQSGITALAFSPDGKTVLTGSWDKKTRLWRAESGQPIGPPIQHQSGVTAVTFSPDGKAVLTGSYDGMARLWRAESGQPIGLPMQHQSFVTAVAFSPDGKTVLTGSVDGKARLWRAESGHPIGPPMQHQDIVYAVLFSPDGKTVLTGSVDGMARLWRTESGQPIGPPMQHQSFVTAVAFSPEGKTVLTGSSDGTARLWRAESGQPIGPLMQHQDYVDAVAFNPDGKIVLTGSSDGTARLWRAESGQPIGPPMQHQSTVYAVAFSPDGKTVLTGSKDGMARLWRADSGQPTGLPMQHENSVVAVAFSPDGKTVLTGSLDNTARLWLAESGQPIGSPMQHQDAVNAVAFSPDGKIVLTGSRDNMARLWRAESGQRIGPPMQHQDAVNAVAFSPDGKTVMTGSRDNTARLWLAESGQPIGQPMQHQNAVNAVAFSPDGKTLLTATSRWVHLAPVVADTLTPAPKASRMLAGFWTDAYRFLDASGNQMQVAVPTTGNAIQIDTLRFDIPNAPPIQGNPKTLLEEWQRKLALKFDENGKIVPRYPVEAVREQ